MAKGPQWWFDDEGVLDAVRKAGGLRVAKAALQVEREAKLSMRTGGGAATDRSAPGEPPFVQTGILRASIQTAMVDVLTFIVGPTRAALYGKILEFGGKNVEPRPFMFPALLQVIPKFKNLFKKLDLARFYKAQKRLRTVPGGPL